MDSGATTGRALIGAGIFGVLVLIGGLVFVLKSGDRVVSSTADSTPPAVTPATVEVPEEQPSAEPEDTAPEPTTEPTTPEKTAKSERSAPKTTKTSGSVPSNTKPKPAPKKKPKVLSKEYKLTKAKSGRVVMSGLVRDCGDVPALNFNYTVDGKTFSSPVTCKKGKAKVSETFPVATPDGPVTVTFSVADAKKTYDKGKVSADFTPKKPVDPAFATPPPNSGSGRRIVYANQAQRVWLVEADGTVTDSYLVSGRKNTPRPGTYKVFSKSEKAQARKDGITMTHMVRFIRPKGEDLAIGFHGIPQLPDGKPLQSQEELGHYRSAGCVRQDNGSAKRLFVWASVGTTVVVLP